MSDDACKPVIVLGPTAGGKSDLAVELAVALHGEVIGADSMQVYRHMDAGTAKPTRAMRERVVHHMVDVVEPTERFTVHDWLQETRAIIERLQCAGKRAVIVGGTNLYLKALLEGMFQGPGQDAAYRASLTDESDAMLHARLREVDPASAERLPVGDRRRVMRALEVHHLSGQPISALQTQWDDDASDKTEGIDCTLIGLHWPVEAINPRINLRVKAMFYPDKVDPQLAADVCINGEDLIAETRRLEAQGVLGEQARQALGYKQVLEFVQGNWSEDEAFEKTKILTRRFAKQQRTWLKRYTNVHWIDASELDLSERLEQALQAAQ